MKVDGFFSCDDRNGSVSFQIGQIRAGDGIVPVSLALYSDGTFMKNGIPIQPINDMNKCMSSVISYTMSFAMSFAMSYALWDVIFFRSRNPEL